MTHAFFKAPKTLEEMIAGRNAIAEWAKLTYGWMGRAPDYKAAFLAHARRQRRLLRAVPGQRPALVQVQPGARALHQPRHHPPAGRSRPPAERGRRRLLPRGEGDRRRHHRVGRQGGRDRIGADQLHLRRPSRADPGAGQEVRRGVHGPDQHAGRQVHLPHLLRDDRDRDGQPVRLSAVEPARRERRGVHHRQGAGALGERVRLRRHGEGQQLLPAHRLPAALRRARLHAAGGEARLHRRPAAQGGGGRRHQGLSRRAGQCRRGDRLAQPVLGAVRRDGARSAALDRRLPPAQHGPRQRLRTSSPPWPTPRSSTSSSRPWRRA